MLPLRSLPCLCRLWAQSPAARRRRPSRPTPAPVYELKNRRYSRAPSRLAVKSLQRSRSQSGDISVVITELGPTARLSWGSRWGSGGPPLDLRGALRTTSATLNVAFAATLSSPGDYCAGVFDSGNVVVTSEIQAHRHAILSAHEFLTTPVNCREIEYCPRRRRRLRARRPRPATWQPRCPSNPGRRHR